MDGNVGARDAGGMMMLAPLAAALLFGLAQYVNGQASRVAGPHRVACWTQLGFVLFSGAVLAVQPAPLPWDRTTPVWGVAAGVGGAVGALCLYAALARSTFTLAVGSSTVTATVAPAGAAMLLFGEDASAARLLLVVLAVASVWLLASSRDVCAGGVTQARADGPRASVTGLTVRGRATGRETSPSALPLALIAGCGFALELVAAGRMPSADIALGLVTWAVSSWGLLLVTLCIRRGGGPLPRGRQGLAAVVAGILTGTAMWLFHLSAAAIGLATTSAIVAVYPAVPILLAILVVREDPGRRALWGLACALAVVLLGGGIALQV